MSKGGYSKLLQKLQESLAFNQQLQQRVQEQDREIAKLNEIVIAAPDHYAAQPTGIENVLLFVEHPLFLTAVGIAGPLLVPLSNWFLLLPAVGFVLAFHRVGVVRGERWFQQVLSFIFVAFIGVATGYGIHAAINKQESDLISGLGSLLRHNDKSPDVYVDGVILQPRLLRTVSYTVHFLNRGNTPATMEFAFECRFLDHISAIPANRRNELAIMFKGGAAADLDNAAFQKIYFDIGSQSPDIEILDTHVAPEVMSRAWPNYKALLFTGRGKYVGHPELRPVDLCYYWMTNDLAHSIKCDVDNTD